MYAAIGRIIASAASRAAASGGARAVAGRAASAAGRTGMARAAASGGGRSIARSASSEAARQAVAERMRSAWESREDNALSDEVKTRLRNLFDVPEGHSGLPNYMSEEDERSLPQVSETLEKVARHESVGGAVPELSFSPPPKPPFERPAADATRPTRPKLTVEHPSDRPPATERPASPPVSDTEFPVHRASTIEEMREAVEAEKRKKRDTPAPETPAPPEPTETAETPEIPLLPPDPETRPKPDPVPHPRPIPPRPVPPPEPPPTPPPVPPPAPEPPPEPPERKPWLDRFTESFGAGRDKSRADRGADEPPVPFMEKVFGRDYERSTGAERERRLSEMEGLAPSEAPPLATDEEIETLDKEARERQLDEIESREEEEAELSKATSLVGKFGDALGDLTKGDVAGFAAAMYAAGVATIDWTESLLASQESLKAYSGTIATSMGQLERQAVQLNVRQAAGTETSFAMLADEISELRDNTQPIEELATNVKNVIGVGLLKATNTVVAAIKPIAEMLQEWFDWAVDAEQDRGQTNRDVIRNFMRGNVVDPNDPFGGPRKDLHRRPPGGP